MVGKAAYNDHWMTELRIGDQLIRFDRDATVLAYSQIQQGDADRCSCSGCRNFSLLRKKAYPDVFEGLLETLGIDRNKEGEAVHDGPKGNLHVYGGWFYFVGELIEAGERNCNAGPDFQYFVGTAFPPPPAIFGKAVVAIEFTTLLPWVLEQAWDPKTDAKIMKAEEIMNRYPKTLRNLAGPE